MELLPSLNFIFSLLTVIGQIIVGAVLILLFSQNEKVISFFSKNAILFSLIVALSATLGSLFYSEVIGFEPCKLCWFQRIFMYPQTILLAIALWKKNEILAVYNSLTLSVIGFIIAGYHYLLQIGVAPELPCSAIGYSVACSQRFVMEFGYITIPMMALTAFSLIIVFMVYKLRG
jgi:disulfide bond formation protein DsbB